MVFYFAQNAQMQIAPPNPDGEPTYQTIGAVQSFEAKVEFTETLLYQFGSILVADASRSEGAVEITLEYAKFGAFASDWFYLIINEAGVTADTSGGGKSVSIGDSTNFPRFRIAAEFTSSDGTEKRYIIANDCWFTTFNWGGGLNEYIIEELTGHASNIIFSDTAPEGWISGA